MGEQVLISGTWYKAAADRNIKDGLLAPEAITRNDVTDEDHVIILGKMGALWDIKTGQAASYAIEQNCVTRGFSIADVRRKAVE
jgi:hypothetical protein